MLLVGLSQPPGGPLVLRAVRGQNASQWWLWGCQEAAGARLCGVAGCQAPGAAQPSSEHLFFPSSHPGRASSLTPCCFLQRGSVLSFPMADDCCLPPSACGAQGDRMALSGASLSQVPVSSRCCDMTNTQALGDWMCHLLCLRVSNGSSIMPLIMLLGVSGLTFELQTECIAS